MTIGMLGDTHTVSRLVPIFAKYKVTLEDRNYLTAADIADALAKREDVDCVIIAESACRNALGGREDVIREIRKSDEMVRILFFLAEPDTDREFQKFCLMNNVPDVFVPDKEGNLNMPDIARTLQKGRLKPENAEKPQLRSGRRWPKKDPPASPPPKAAPVAAAKPKTPPPRPPVSPQPVSSGPAPKGTGPSSPRVPPPQSSAAPPQLSSATPDPPIPERNPPANEPKHRPIQKPVKKMVRVHVERIETKRVEVPVVRVVEEPVEVEKIVKKRVEVPVEKIIEERVEVIQPITKTVEVPVQKVVKWFVRVPVEKIVKKRVEVPVIREVEESVEVEQIVKKIVEIPVIREVEEQVEVEQIIKKRVEVPVEKIIEERVEVPTERVVTIEVPKGLDIPEPPPPLRGTPANLIIGVFNVSRGAGASTMALALAREGARRKLRSFLIGLDGSGDYSSIKSGDKRLTILYGEENGILSAVSAGARLIVLDFGLLVELDPFGELNADVTLKQNLFAQIAQCHAVYGMCLSAPWHRRKLEYFNPMNPRPTFISDQSWHKNVAVREKMTPEAILDKIFPPPKQKAAGTSPPAKGKSVKQAAH